MGGIGSRFGSDVPKQFTLVNKKPLFTYIANKLAKQNCITGIVVVVTESWLDYAKEWIEKLQIQKIVNVVKGETVRKLRPEPAFTQAIRPKS